MTLGLAAVVIAAAYALVLRGIDASPSVLTALTALVSHSRFLLFVALPLGLVSVASAVRHDERAQRVLRYGSRARMLLARSGALLATLVIVSAAVGVAWSAVALSTHGRFPSLISIVQSVGVVAGGAALFGVGISIAYWVLLIIRWMTGSFGAVIGGSVLLWLFAVLPSLGVFQEPDPLNLIQYITLRTVGERPHLVAALFLAASLAFGATMAVARWKDTGLASVQLSSRVRSLVFITALGLVGVAVAPVGLSESTGPLAILFGGAGASLTAYLLGTTLVVSLGFAALAPFVLDWSTRADLLRIRYGSSARWLRSMLGEAWRWAAQVLVGLSFLFLTVRYAVTGQPPFAHLGSELALLGRVFLASLLLIVVLAGAVVASGSGAAPLVLSVVGLALGAIPAFHVPWNPLLSWSATWRGQDAVIAALSAGSVLAVCIFVLLAFLAHDSKGYRVDHQP